MSATGGSKPRRRRRLAIGGLLALGLCALLFALHTRSQLVPLPEVLPPGGTEPAYPRLTSREGQPLRVSYQNRWNVYDRVAYHQIPELLRHAFVMAEDQRFFEHGGVDWLARAHAVVQNLRAGRAVRGASTISEQVVRILHPRARTLWSRWLEGLEVGRLERRFGKAQILELYLNQVPYARQRRGVVQAARTYFDRDLDTLSPKEMLALAVLVRSPSRLDPLRDPEALERPLLRLAERLEAAGWLEPAELEAVARDRLVTLRPRLPVEAGHFVSFAGSRLGNDGGFSRRGVATTLDASLQSRVQDLLDQRVASLGRRGVGDGAALVVDHRSDQILAWTNAFGFSDREGGQIDKVTSLRQPGSALKPFVYGMALEAGWTAATLIEDAPLADAVGHGLHSYRNYSRIFYGPLRLREALGNSLNTPAVRLARQLGGAELLERLHRLGFSSLDRHPDFYGDGLALGNGEVSLYELVRAYAALARGGLLRPLRWRLDEMPAGQPAERVFGPEVSSLLADILSDREARSREFGHHSILDLPVPTAVKTGTSNDYRDAWAVGFSHRYTVGVWVGNVDRRAMQEVSGSSGPAIVLRAIFAELHRHRPSQPLYLSRRLARIPVCRESGERTRPGCPQLEEWFRPGRAPQRLCRLHAPTARAEAPRTTAPPVVRLESPTPGLHLALDPRIPDPLEAFPFRLASAPDHGPLRGGPLRGLGSLGRVEWIVDGRLAAITDRAQHLWPLRPGVHTVMARVWHAGEAEPAESQTVRFTVK